MDFPGRKNFYKAKIHFTGVIKMMRFDLKAIPTPCYVCDEAVLEQNLKILDSVQKRSGCKIIMALKGFAMFIERMT